MELMIYFLVNIVVIFICMSVLWVISLLFCDVFIVDMFWGFGFVIIVWIFFFFVVE